MAIFNSYAKLPEVAQNNGEKCWVQQQKRVTIIGKTWKNNWRIAVLMDLTKENGCLQVFTSKNGEAVNGYGFSW